MKTREITIKVDIRETGSAPLLEHGVEKLKDGLSRLVLESEAVMNIDALEASLLHTSRITTYITGGLRKVSKRGSLSRILSLIFLLSLSQGLPSGGLFAVTTKLFQVPPA